MVLQPRLQPVQFGVIAIVLSVISECRENEEEDSNLTDSHLLSLKGCIMQIRSTCLAHSSDRHSVDETLENLLALN